LTSEDLDPDPAMPAAAPLASRIDELVAVESSERLLYRDAAHDFNKQINITRQVVPDEEALPFEPGSFDLVLSSLSLHWINDLPGVLTQINTLLKPDCAFVGAMLGGDTLFELRTSLQLAEQERKGGISPHVSPLADVRDVGGLLQKAGFKMLTVDIDDIIVDYPDIFALMQDLQAMGEGNAILGREMGQLSRDIMLASEGIYRELHGNPDGTIPATFRIIYMIGWHESEDQAKPLPRGSGDVNLKDLLEKK
jgi:NADH dehydrogenase [ubiquinone] 1 alpha subcomplex assembly factor 5